MFLHLYVYALYNYATAHIVKLFSYKLYGTDIGCDRLVICLKSHKFIMKIKCWKIINKQLIDPVIFGKNCKQTFEM